MSKEIRAIKGMNDILPGESDTWQFFEATVRDWAAAYGYHNIRTPIVEETSLFVRSIGEVTDIVEKEMYSFEDSLNGDKLTLRPEGTASCLRAVIQHNLLHQGPQRLWYMGQMYRHERPQKGRYRQFHQVGVEALGFDGPDVDAELLLMTVSLWKRLGLQNLQLQLNSLGTSEERARHREALIAYLAQHQDTLDDDGKRRLYTNPLRVLDSKNPAMQAICDAAPKLVDYLGDASRQHFDTLQQLLTDCGVPFVINPRLVRGLDYYNLTVFEWVTNELGSQGTVCGGGRYDGLVEQLGGKPTAACGFGMGVERLLLLLEAQRITPPVERPDVYLVHQGTNIGSYVMQTAEMLREQGLKVILHGGQASFKSQMKKADASGARFAAIIGENEAISKTVSIKPLLGEGAQQIVEQSQAVSLIKQ
ncbi:histidyl-tRNA synthetase [Chitinivorax tropicus]|uniref:Histidine--tRNA ligase n=1 Tax=Chitinivorax tropicus TaxID=714531 RepID=A0A840MKT4_9PROT|nr:histidine--tRNA ligase [Chitinivorax tropicus]MBB5019784.1 histidyl-tRNA synthetase [Chitinivorax tropicus]